ncbi:MULTISPECIES: DUF3618 domain-containing protein [Pseudomonas]|uniref:DUF3618 domain-containing protein n=1 Tax=Pseudomonas lini TaxID=163011 RepID=A0A0J6HLW5_9PSED|nr:MULTISPECIES: DUF3618 domain-containing protein [Pseudomonas]KAB0507223.1 DUF3618 domain-containing protein [Pseudomonas lini]KMM95493.1 hypothetical protein TU81_03610 [Pseudomonas lini]KNH46005.1 hypothetical protein ACS73_12620 [Pseudomonas lini]MDT9673222.1 DUF3618 domain-containing protein [Pseudomonas sp. JV414]SDT38267.1 Membrane-anchored ribosome-binding protein, inhibits growth in stationary phase, ElaB/YqjD/DUF883 family [Pseudomonas lini]
MNREFETEAAKSPETIEREIDAQRENIGHIVDALESKFTPGQMFDQALLLMQSNGSTFLTNLGTSVRNNPVPAVLTSVGLMWLMMSQNRPPTPREYRVEPEVDWADDLAEGLTDGMDSARQRLHDTTDSLKDSYQAVKGKAAHLSDSLHAKTDHLSHAVHDTSDRLARRTHEMGDQFSHLLKEQPLMMAAVGMAVGALLGAALPTTATERRYLGRTSASLTGKVKQQAREGYEAVREKVMETTEPHEAIAGETGEMRKTTSETSADLSRGLGTS